MSLSCSWYGMVWYGMVWYGVRRGMVWFSISPQTQEGEGSKSTYPTAREIHHVNGDALAGHVDLFVWLVLLGIARQLVAVSGAASCGGRLRH